MRLLYRVCIMSRDLQEGPTAAEIERDAAYYNSHRNTGNIHNPIPTIAVFVSGGLVQDICFDGAVRVIVIDSDCEEAADATGIYTNPTDGRARWVWASEWTDHTEPSDPDYVRAAVKAFDDPWAPLHDNEEERARIRRECEEAAS